MLDEDQRKTLESRTFDIIQSIKYIDGIDMIVLVNINLESHSYGDCCYSRVMEISRRN